MKSPIFLLGSGRCGSTLLQRALNAHPDIVLYGEHEGFLAPLANSYQKLTQTKDIQRWVYGEDAVPAETIFGEIRDKEVDICWINNFTREDVFSQYRHLVLSLLAKDLDLEKVHWGFKEIRYHEGQHVISFLLELFPDARFVFMFRNPADTIASGMTAWEDPELFMHEEQALREVVWNRFKRWSSKSLYLLNEEAGIGENCYIVRYEDLVTDPASHMDHIFGMLDLETPDAALDMFNYRIAGTDHHPRKSELVNRIQEFQRNCKHPELRQVCARMGYEHLA